MHKFIDNIIAFSLKNKFFIFFFTVLAVIAGIVSFKYTPIDAFPDVPTPKYYYYPMARAERRGDGEVHYYPY